MQRACAVMGMFESLMVLVDTISSLPPESREVVVSNLHNACVELDKSIREELVRIKEAGGDCHYCPVCNKFENATDSLKKG